MAWTVRDVCADDVDQLAELLKTVRTTHNTGIRWPITRENVARHMCGPRRWPLARRWVVTDAGRIAAFAETYVCPDRPEVLLGTNNLVHPDFHGRAQVHFASLQMMMEEIKRPGILAVKSYTTPELFDYYRFVGFRLYEGTLFNHLPLITKTPALQGVLQRFDLMKHFVREAPDVDSTPGFEALFYSWSAGDDYLKVWVDPEGHGLVGVATPQGSTMLRLVALEPGHCRLRLERSRNGAAEAEEWVVPRDPWKPLQVERTTDGLALRLEVPPGLAWKISEVEWRGDGLQLRVCNCGEYPLRIEAPAGESLLLPDEEGLLSIAARSGTWELRAVFEHQGRRWASSQQVRVEAASPRGCAVLWPDGAALVGPDHHVQVDALGGTVRVFHPRTGAPLVTQHSDEVDPPYHAAINGYHLSEFSGSTWELAAESSEAGGELKATVRSPVRPLTLTKTIRVLAGGALSVAWQVEGAEAGTVHAVCMMHCARGTPLLVPLSEGVAAIPCQYEEFPYARDFTAENQRLGDHWLGWQDAGETHGIAWSAPDSYYLDFHPAHFRPQVAVGLPVRDGRTGPIVIRPCLPHWRMLASRSGLQETWPGLSRAALRPQAVYVSRSQVTASLLVEERRETPQEYLATVTAPGPVTPARATVRARWQAPGAQDFAIGLPDRCGLFQVTAEVKGAALTKRCQFALVKYDPEPVAVQAEQRQGYEWWTLDNGLMRFSVVPEFGAAVVDLRIHDGPNLLYSTFPRARRMLGADVWYGGISAHAHCQGEVIIGAEVEKAAPVTVAGRDGVRWQGLELRTRLGDGMALVTTYLTLGRVPFFVICHRFEGALGSVDLPLWVQLPDQGWEQEAAVRTREGSLLRRTVPPGHALAVVLGPGQWAGGTSHGHHVVVTNPAAAQSVLLAPLRIRMLGRLMGTEQVQTTYVGVLRSWEEADLLREVATPFPIGSFR